MKILHLTLKRKWYDMILSGIKKEEYRSIKPYWDKRFLSDNQFKSFDAIKFTNGYAKDAPNFTIEFLGFDTDTGNTEWGAIKGEQYFILKLGKILCATEPFMQS